MGMEQRTAVQFLLGAAVTFVAYTTVDISDSLATGIHMTVPNTSGLVHVIAMALTGDSSSLHR